MSRKYEYGVRPDSPARRRRYCPVCWQTVHRSCSDNIQDHWDSQGVDVCPMGGLSFGLAGWGRRKFRVIEKSAA